MMYVPHPWSPTNILTITHSQIKMFEDDRVCKSLCLMEDVTPDDAVFINDRIREDYALNWLIDGLPAAEMKSDTRSGDMFFDMGFNLGNNEGHYENLPALNNHYDIVLRHVYQLYVCPKFINCVVVDTTCLRLTPIASLGYLYGHLGADGINELGQSFLQS